MKEKKKISNKMLTLILILNYVLFFFVLFIGGFIDVAKEMGDKFIYYSVFMFFFADSIWFSFFGNCKWS